MRKLILSLLVVGTLISVANACLPPMQPLPPIGCTSANATLAVAADGECYWVFIGCGL